MCFKKELALFLHDNDMIKFGNFKLSSGNVSNFYLDMRMLYGYPQQFYKITQRLLKMIINKTGLGNFDCITAIPTSGLIITSALALESMKPLIYVRNYKKKYGMSKQIEGKMSKNVRTVIIDDVMTTGESIEKCIKMLRKNSIIVTDIYIIVNRNSKPNKFIESEKICIHEVIHVDEIFKFLNIRK
ncbi:MAG: phosphoribosyltransferase family protein [Thaumarchaeota archaeon]|nr:phosphoribosyltransferase family protein [Nitrososphaerota archaeon]